MITQIVPPQVGIIAINYGQTSHQLNVWFMGSPVETFPMHGAFAFLGSNPPPSDTSDTSDVLQHPDKYAWFTWDGKGNPPPKGTYLWAPSASKIPYHPTKKIPKLSNLDIDSYEYLPIYDLRWVANGCEFFKWSDVDTFLAKKMKPPGITKYYVMSPNIRNNVSGSSGFVRIPKTT